MDYPERHETDAGEDGRDDLIAALIHGAGPREDPPMDHYREVLEATHSQWARSVAARRRRRIGLGLAASIGAALVVVGLMSRFDGGNTGPLVVAATDATVGGIEFRSTAAADWTALRAPGVAITSGTRIRTSGDGRAGLRLEDGTSLRLDRSSEVSFESAGRVQLTRGGVYIDTGSNPGSARRVEVVTPAGIVWDLGTQFEVRYREDILTLRIREGRVILERETDEIKGVAGEQVQLDSTGRIERTAFSPFDAEWHWAQAVAPLPYEHTLTVHELLEWVARETGREVHFSEPGLATRASRIILHGNPHRLLPMEALAVMLETTDLTYTVAGDGEILIATRAR